MTTMQIFQAVAARKMTPEQGATLMTGIRPYETREDRFWIYLGGGFIGAALFHLVKMVFA
jgi:hypothetical protein